MFIKGFKIKAYYKDSTGLARAWYILVALPLFLYGYILDVLINQTVGKDFFGEASKLLNDRIKMKEEIREFGWAKTEAEKTHPTLF